MLVQLVMSSVCEDLSYVFLPSLFDNVLMTLVLVVLDELSTGQPDVLR